MNEYQQYKSGMSTEDGLHENNRAILTFDWKLVKIEKMVIPGDIAEFISRHMMVGLKSVLVKRLGLNLTQTLSSKDIRMIEKHCTGRQSCKYHDEAIFDIMGGAIHGAAEGVGYPLSGKDFDWKDFKGRPA